MKIYFLPAMLVLSLYANSQQLLPFSVADKITGKMQWGYTDRFYSSYAIKPGFDSTIAFADGAGRVKVEGKFGFIDKTGRMIVKPTFESAQDFSEGLAVVTTGGKMLYVDNKGVDVFKKTFDMAMPFVDGYAIVGDNAGLRGYINKTGSLIIPFQFKRSEPFQNGIAPVLKEGETTWKSIDTKGNTIFTFSDQVNYAKGRFDDGVVSVYRKDGPDSESHFDFVNIKGEYICSAPYLETRPFKYGRAIVSKRDRNRNVANSAGYKNGVINNKGKEIIPPIYTCLVESAIKGIYFYGQPTSSGFGCSGYGLIDSNGLVISPANYASFTKLNDTTFLCQETGGGSKKRYLLLTTKGNELLSKRQEEKEFTIVGSDTLLTLFTDYDESLSMTVYNLRTGLLKENATEGIFIFEKEKLVLIYSREFGDGTIMTTAGRIIIDKVYTKLIYQDDPSDKRSHFILLKKDSEPSFRLFSLASGKYVPGNYDFGKRAFDYSGHFNSGMLPVNVNGKWGYMDSLGKIKITPAYEKANDFHGGWAVVQKKNPNGSGSTMHYINTVGKELPGIKADFLNASNFSEGMAYYKPVSKPGTYTDEMISYFNNAGKIIYRSTNSDYYKHGKFSNGMAAVSNAEGLYGFINTKGELVIPCQYNIPPKASADDEDDDDTDFSKRYVGYLEFNKKGEVAVEKDGKKIWIDKTGKKIM